jgi:hypothetical protein
VRGNSQRILVVNTEEKKPLGIFRCRGDDNIEVDIKEIGYESVLDFSGSG